MYGLALKNTPTGSFWRTQSTQSFMMLETRLLRLSLQPPLTKDHHLVLVATLYLLFRMETKVQALTFWLLHLMQPQESAFLCQTITQLLRVTIHFLQSLQTQVSLLSPSVLLWRSLIFVTIVFSHQRPSLYLIFRITIQIRATYWLRLPGSRTQYQQQLLMFVAFTR